MVDIVIFGTGSNGERAWQAVQARTDINVVCFADNDARKHGTSLHDRPIVNPAELPGRAWDFVVVASMYARDICRQLADLGVDDQAVIAPDLNTFSEGMAALPARKHARRGLELEDGSTVSARDLPEVLILTYETLNSSHGTGVLLQRYFGDFPADKLFSVCHTATGQPWLKGSLVLPPADGPSDRAAALVTALQAGDFAPKLVYATAFNENDLELLDVVLSVVPPGTPVIQHFMDYMPHDPAVFDERFRSLSNRVREIWALTEGMATELTARYSRPVRLVTALHQEAPAVAKTEHEPVGSDFRAVILGNLWQPWTLPVIREAWKRCQAAIPGLRPIDWYVHPARVQALIDAGYELGDEVVWRGFHSGNALQTRLREADLALLPFNVHAEALDGYTRYSLPSRLTELCGAGLPIVALASPDTEPARFLTARDCGVAISGVDVDAVAALLLSLLGDPGRREALGAAARQVAETEFAMGPFHKQLLSTFVRVASEARPPRGWTGVREEKLVRLSGSERIASAALEDVITDRVHYACGRNVLPGWLNLDGFDESYPWGAVPSELGARIFRMDLTGPHPLPDNHFRLGYSEDFIEHIDQPSFVSFLCEAYRTFQRGGVLRLSSPGLEGILRRHLRGADWSAASVLHQEAYVQWWHKHFLCFEAVDQIARRIGWREVRQCAYGESTIPEIVLDTRPDQADLNLVVELVK